MAINAYDSIYTLPYSLEDIFSSEIPFPTKIKSGGYYYLLSYLSNLFEGKLFLDCGTQRGESAVALAHNKKNEVISYDLYDKLNYDLIENYSNIQFKLMDVKEEKLEIFRKATIIFLDIDPHDGIQEKYITDKLEEANFKGILIIDDIFTTKNDYRSLIRDRYQNIYYECGAELHHTGVAMVDFSKKIWSEKVKNLFQKK